MNDLKSPRARAMIIDASMDSAAELRSMLARANIDVVEWWRTGVGWMSPMQQSKADLVVVDFVLPRRDGLYVVQKVHELDPAIGVIFVHSYEGLAANHLETKAFDKGAGAVLQKPFTEKRFALLADRLVALAQKRRVPTKVKMPGAAG